MYTTPIALVISVAAILIVVGAVKLIDWFANRKIKRVEIEQPGTEPDRRKTIITYDNHTTII